MGTTQPNGVTMMWNVKMNWRSPTHWILTIACCAAAAIVGYVVKDKGLASSESAAWVQAIGSIGAIAGAAWIASWQSSQSRKNEQERREELWALYYELVERCLIQLKTLRGLCLNSDDPALNEFAFVAVNAAVNSLENFPKEQMSHSARFKSALTLQGMIRDTTNYIGVENDNISKSSDVDISKKIVKLVGTQLDKDVKEIQTNLSHLRSITPGS